MSQRAPTLAPRPRLKAAGLVRLATVMLSVIFQAGLFFVAAGTQVLRAWIYYGSVLGYLALAIVALLRFFPATIEVINERGTIKNGTKAWDKLFAVFYTLLLLVTPLVAGLDVGAHASGRPSALFVPPALALTLASLLLAHWTMVANKYAELGVRIQEERGQRVVSSGPYRYVRHPLYVSVIATNLVYPLAVGSLWAYTPGALIVALFIWRTAMEDRTLKAELSGYCAYARRVRFRLLPGVW
jgi:protein-S-isoprenylcysteine O-methyltransferase Ste14